MPPHKPLYQTRFKSKKSSLFSLFTVIVSGLLTTTLLVAVLSPAQAQTQAQTKAQAQTQPSNIHPSRTDIAQSTGNTELPQSELGIRYNPPNRGAPGNASTSDAGSRSCGLMVFGPAQSHWGETLQPFPSFWLYASNPGSVAVELTAEETAEVLHQGTFEIAEGQVMTSYTLPEIAAALSVDKAYRWDFSLDCPGDPDPSANGVIVLREASESLESADLLTQARQLAAEGFWFDAVDTLNQLRLEEASIDRPQTNSQTDSQIDSQIEPSAATQDWRSLLEQGGWREVLGDRFEQVATAAFSSILSELPTEETCAIETSPAIESASEPVFEVEQ